MTRIDWTLLTGISGIVCWENMHLLQTATGVWELAALAGAVASGAVAVFCAGCAISGAK